MLLSDPVIDLGSIVLPNKDFEKEWPSIEASFYDLLEDEDSIDGKEAIDYLVSRPIFRCTKWLSSPNNSYIHWVAIFSAASLAYCVFSFLSWGLARKLIRKIPIAVDSWDLWISLISNIALLIPLGAIFSVILMSIVYPYGRYALDLFLMMLFGVGGVEAFLGIAVASILLLFGVLITEVWFKILVGVCLLPILVTCMIFIFCLITKPFEVYIHKTLNGFFIKMTDFEGGPISYSIQALALITSVLGLLKALFSLT